MSQQIVSTEPVQATPTKEFPKKVGVYPEENPRAEEYLQGRTWTLREFLSGFNCSARFLPNDIGVIVTLERDATIGDAFKKMVQHDITSIPIIDPTTRKPLYVLGLPHIVDYLLHKFKQEDFVPSMWARIQNILSPKSESFTGTSLMELEQNISLQLDPAPTVYEDCLLSDAVRMMLESGSHRLLVTNLNGDLVNIITQSRIVELISLLIGSIPKCAKSIETLGLGTKQVIMVNQNQTVFEAFTLMRDMKLSALPVVNSEGVLIGTISMSDIKLLGWSPEFWMLIGRPLHEYLKELSWKPENPIRSRRAFALLNEKGAPSIVRCREWHSLGHVIRTVAYFKVHRMFVVDATGMPTTVISLSDILREIVKD